MIKFKKLQGWKSRSICAKCYQRSCRLCGLRREVNFHDREREAATKHTSLRPVSFTFSLLSLFSYACSSFCKQIAHFYINAPEVYASSSHFSRCGKCVPHILTSGNLEGEEVAFSSGVTAKDYRDSRARDHRM